MSHKMFQSIAFTAIGSVASLALINALPMYSAQAAVLTYESNLSVTSTVILPNQATTQVPIANATVTFLKAPSSQPNLFDYTFQSLTASFLSTTYTQADLLTPTNIALAQSLTTFLPTEYQSRYQTLLSNVVSGTVPTYTGDGDFPPATPLSYTFSAQDVGEGVQKLSPSLSPSQLSVVNAIAALFPNGGETTLSSTVIASTPDISPAVAENSSTATAEGAPEPTTMAGLALAGAGMAAARRRLSKRKIAA